jgi:hypothetical protein
MICNAAWIILSYMKDRYEKHMSLGWDLTVWLGERSSVWSVTSGRSRCRGSSRSSYHRELDLVGVVFVDEIAAVTPDRCWKRHTKDGTNCRWSRLTERRHEQKVWIEDSGQKLVREFYRTLAGQRGNGRRQGVLAKGEGDWIDARRDAETHTHAPELAS